MRGEGPLRDRGVGWLRAESNSRLQPGSAVAVLPLGAQAGTNGEELGERRDGLDAPRRRDANESVRIEIVAE
jgi:hypothetical protein